MQVAQLRTTAAAWERDVRDLTWRYNKAWRHGGHPSNELCSDLTQAERMVRLFHEWANRTETLQLRHLTPYAD